MMLSFIIPAHNEEQYVGATIAAIHAAMQGLSDRSAYEVIVAADGCTDATVAIAQSNGAKVVAHDRRQIAATRNLGAAAASGDVLVFVDADTRVGRPVIQAMVAELNSGAIGGGAPVVFDGPVPLYARTIVTVVTAVFRWARLTGGAFMFCTRDAFTQAGGWNEAYYAGEEIFLASALKRQGPFKIVGASVVTSGRKVRTFSAVEILGLAFRGVFTPWIMKDRSKLEFFYGPRRSDPFVQKGQPTGTPEWPRSQGVSDAPPTLPAESTSSSPAPSDADKSGSQIVPDAVIRH
jgi:glycosyltransferase involved in cell wall biosynthesis